MTVDLNHFTTSTANWRKTLRQNTYRTYIVIAIFFLIYLSIGILVDMYLLSISKSHLSVSQIFYYLRTGQFFPIATVVMFIIASISLIVSFFLYDKLMLLGTEYQEITAENASTPAEKQLYNIVAEMVIAASLNYMPKIYIINANYMNAFASGYSERSAMIAITRGLMEKLNRDELAAVIAHELSHIRHLDIKLTLTASLLSNLMLMVLDIFFYNAMFAQKRNDRGRNGLAFIIILLRYILPVINLLLILYLSRTRELMADAGSVQMLRNNEPLASALLKISQDHSQNQAAYNTAYRNTPHENVRREAYFFDPLEAGIEDVTSLNDLFSTHPSIEVRLRALGYNKKKD